MTGGALRRGDRGERTVMRKADDQPSVNVPLRADPIVHYTIKSTVNGHAICIDRLSYRLPPFSGMVGSGA